MRISPLKAKSQLSNRTDIFSSRPREAKTSRKLNRTSDETAELIAPRCSLLNFFLILGLACVKYLVHIPQSILSPYTLIYNSPSNFLSDGFCFRFISMVWAIFLLACVAGAEKYRGARHVREGKTCVSPSLALLAFLLVLYIFHAPATQAIFLHKWP